MSDISNEESSGEITRPVMVRMNDEGTNCAESVLTAPQMCVRAECHIPPRIAIPVLFLPGIMGTRLKVKNTDSVKAWFPPESLLAGLIEVLKDLGWSAAARQRLLDPKNTEVDDTGPARVPKETSVWMGDAPGDSDKERAKHRGWSQLHGDSYGEILNVLEQTLAQMMHCGAKPSAKWQSAVMDWQEQDGPRTGAQRLGALKDFKPLDNEALKTAASAFYPVYAVGYNWLQSNKDSGERLAGEIERIIKYYRERKKICEKVILVTHSMGGLVVRSGMQEAGMDNRILAVVHGVMPAIGAPAVYKRMRSGFEGITQPIFGRNAAQATAVMANSFGGLELLPTRQYRAKDQDGIERHWLRAVSGSEKPFEAVIGQQQRGGHPDRSTMLGEVDIYEDIYLNNSNWWRMVKEELINPAGREVREKATREGEEAAEDDSAGKSDFDIFIKRMDKVREFHNRIEDKYHPFTYASYADDSDQPAWNEVQWKSDQRIEGDCRSGELIADDHNGRVQIKAGGARYGFEIQDAAGSGDATVPAESGAAPTPHVLQMFRHEGKAKGHTSYEHQKSYQADIVQAATLYSIARLAADSEWLQKNKSKA